MGGGEGGQLHAPSSFKFNQVSSHRDGPPRGPGRSHITHVLREARSKGPIAGPGMLIGPLAEPLCVPLPEPPAEGRAPA